MPQKQKPADASSTLGQTIDEVSTRPTTTELEHLLIRIEKHLNWSSANPLADADKIDDLLDEIRAVWRRSAQGQTKERNMVKDDPLSKAKAVLMVSSSTRSPELVALLSDVVEHPETWMAKPSVQLGGRRPIDLVGTEEESKILDILHAVDQGLF